MSLRQRAAPRREARLGSSGACASILLLVLLCAGARAGADRRPPPRVPEVDVIKQAQQLLDNGAALFKAGDLEGARNAFVRASALVPDKPNPYRWLGLVEVRLGRCKQALDAFDQFLSRVQLGDPRAVEVVTLRDRCRDELAPRAGLLVVESSPPGAEVRLRAAGDPLLGTTPLGGTSIPAGRHVVAIHKPGYGDILRGVSIEDKQVVRLDVILQPLPQPARRRYWIIGAVLGPLAAAGLGVGLGIGLTRDPPRSFPPVSAQ